MQLTPAELLVSDVIGRLIEFWGFKRNMGRVWSVLYLSTDPLSADDLRDSLKISSGAVSMTLTELGRWGVVRKVWIQGERRDFFSAETQLWKMVSRVFSERERTEIVSAIDALQEALQLLDKAKDNERTKLQRERVRQLLDLARLGLKLIDALLATGKLDIEPLARLRLGLGDR